jgi:type II secretory pathway pseudopilin PulG
MKDHMPTAGTKCHRRAKTDAVRGFTLLEAIVAIMITVVIFAVFSATISAAYLLRKSTYVTQASNFIREELDSLRTLPYTELLNRTNGNFLGISLTRGDWLEVTAVNPPSGSRVLTLQAAQPALTHETGLLVIPGNYHTDMDLVAKINVSSASPAGWGSGIAFDYRDSENHYRYRITSGGIALDKVVHDTVTTLWSHSAAYATNTWYTLEVVTSGTSITLKLNGTAMTTLTDSTFSVGDAAIMSLDGALPSVDDVSLTENGTTTSYNFESDTLGQMPTVWQRFVYVDLPNGQGTLTIADYLGMTGIKTVTATVTWTDSGVTNSVSGTTLIAQ